MTLDCPHCGRQLEFTGEPPSFCGYCGKAMAAALEKTTGHVDVAATRPHFSTQPGEDTPPPSSLGGYRILKKLGKGGMGAVYEAEQESSGQRVAVKVIAPECAESEDALERFRQEGRLASLIAHPRCVFVLAADEEAGHPYIVMELIPGTTLKELVEKNGPLPVQDAVSKILDVMEGLQEAHRLGVIHRDVKPSNCFLLESGRVKVGDFGLSKSLVSGPDLTRTGTFLGTLQYASPEQIKGEYVDYRTDVYAVAATLFFLLTGQAPFQGKDAAAMLAKAVSEEPTSLRSIRPELPAALEKVIRCGLDRDPQRRWRSLEQFRVALLRFVPGRLSIGGMGLRTAAFVIDDLLFSFLSSIALVPFMLGGDAEVVWATIISDGLWAALFWLLEGRWGATPGKWLLGLRVYDVAGSALPGFARVLVRTVVFSGLTTTILWDILYLTLLFDRRNLVWPLLILGLRCAGIVAVLSTMRERNGYRGLHEFLSGTRVVRLPWPKKPEVFTSRQPNWLTANLVAGDGIPQTIGSLRVRGVLRQDASGQWLLAENPVLGRLILLWCRPSPAQPLEAKRRNLNRVTRLRWLGAGHAGNLYWDAFLAPMGSPLADVCDRTNRLSWRSFRGILEQLTEELASSCADGTLPHVLTVDQVWIQPSGQVQILDEPLVAAPAEAPGSSEDPQQQALRLLRQAAQLALEGQVRPGELEGQSGAIKAPAPEHAAEILQRLGGEQGGYACLADLQTALAATQDRPVEVNRALRAGHVVILGLALFMPLAMMFGMLVGLATMKASQIESQPSLNESSWHKVVEVLAITGIVAIFPALWVIWAFLFRGGLTLSMIGATVVAADGRRASRLRCAARAMIVWAPLVALLSLSMTISLFYGGDGIAGLATVVLALGYLAGCVILALWLPARSWHDRLAGTYLVPK